LVSCACDSGYNFAIQQKNLPGSSFHTSTPSSTLASTVPVVPTTTPPNEPACTAGDLVAKGGSSQNPGDPGSAIGQVLIVNDTPSACQVDGIPSIELLKSNGQLLGVESGAPLQKALNAVVIEANKASSAELVFTWTNWCQSAPTDLTMQLDLANAGGILDAPLDGSRGTYIPTCSRPGTPSILRVQYAYVDSGTAQPANA
jgi:hypothetical protein